MYLYIYNFVHNSFLSYNIDEITKEIIYLALSRRNEQNLAFY